MKSPEKRKPPRADAARNRERLLDATSALVAEKAGELSLAAVAERAGVGIGTLYRHFPNRDALLAGLYRNEVARLKAEADILARELPPLEALTTWLEHYAALMAVKYGFADAMKSALNSDAEVFSQSRVQAAGALSSLLEAAAEAGAVRRGIDPEDVLMAVAATISASLNREDSAARGKRLLGLIVDGLRFQEG
ncbi:TetR/AcrR family transcriptional regulator [Mesorhizobium sp. IMUNJ 23232]|uniref:TetR/AcrR family transcriptional regulator n=1 Tax=Mesorhizobium sp. IMUNJ 23232 TaxID=3376064 RepID=UPI0037881E2D